MLRQVLFPAAILILGCGDPLFLEARAAAVCQHLPAQRLQVPAAMRTRLAELPPERRRVELEHAFDFDVAAQVSPQLKGLVDLSCSLTSVRLTAVNGGDLGFIDEAHLQVRPSATSGLATRHFEYVRTELAPRAVAWNVEAFDVAACLASGSPHYVVSLAGTIPEGDLVVDIDACVETSVKLDAL